MHEHWNNPIEKQYSRNLGTGDGIELVALHLDTIDPALQGNQFLSEHDIEQISAYPNPFTNSLTVASPLIRKGAAVITIHDVNGNLITRESIIESNAGTVQLMLGHLPPGTYVLSLHQAARKESAVILKL